MYCSPGPTKSPLQVGEHSGGDHLAVIMVLMGLRILPDGTQSLLSKVLTFLIGHWLHTMSGAH